MDSFKRWIAVTDLFLASLLGISEKTLSRCRTSGTPLSAVSSDRLYRVARIAALAADVLESKPAAVSWLKRRKLALGNERPLDLLATTAGTDEVEKASHSNRARRLFVIVARRIIKKRRADSAFTGQGARIAGGRSSFPGLPVVYTSGSLALAALETFVHLEKESAGLAFVAFEIRIPGPFATGAPHYSSRRVA